jgi:hypothetical protein
LVPADKFHGAFCALTIPRVTHKTMVRGTAFV